MKVTIVKYLNSKGKVVEMRKDNFKGRYLPKNIIKEYEIDIKDENSNEIDEWEDYNNYMKENSEQENVTQSEQAELVRKQGFKPFTLNIEVNTLDEAKSLWNVFNLSSNAINGAIKNSCCNGLNPYSYWTQLYDNILESSDKRTNIRKD